MTEKQNTDLLPCPFCGGEGISVTKTGELCGYEAQCNDLNCLASTWSTDEHGAIRRWNTRNTAAGGTGDGQRQSNVETSRQSRVSSPTLDDEMREAFERNMNNPYGWDLTRIGDGYKSPYVETMWVGFRSAKNTFLVTDDEATRDKVALTLRNNQTDILYDGVHRMPKYGIAVQGGWIDCEKLAKAVIAALRKGV